MHSTDNVLLGRLAHRVLLVVRQDDHVLSCITEILVQVRAHVLHVIDAPSQLPALVEVVYSDEERLASSSTITVLETVALRCAIAKGLRGLRWGWRSIVVSLHVCVRVDSR